MENSPAGGSLNKKTPKEKRALRKIENSALSAAKQIPRSLRIVRISPDRGYGAGLYEIVGLYERGIKEMNEVRLKPWGWAGEDVTIYRFHTKSPSPSEILQYVNHGVPQG